MMIARCKKEHMDGGVQTDMTKYRCVRVLDSLELGKLTLYPPFDRKSTPNALVFVHATLTVRSRALSIINNASMLSGVVSNEA